MDGELQLRRAARGDRAALQGVIERWWRPLRRWAVWECGDLDLAEEAVQEALVRLVRHIPGYDPSRPFEPWLRALVRNAARDVRDRRGRTEGREIGGPMDAYPVDRDPGRDLDVRRAATDALSRFEALSARQRELVDLVDVQGRTPKEVAETLGLTAGAVRNQLHTARRRLRAALVDREAEILPLLREA